jgi:hypothetical protein
MRRTCSVLVGLAVLCIAQASSAVFHAAVIDEVMTSYNGDANVQFIEIRMLAVFQNFVTNSVLAAFDANGNYINDILVVPSNLANAGNGVRWLVGTSAFQTASGITPDFPMPAGILPSGGGMVCYGGGGGIAPAMPNTWSRTDFATYVDCVAYGTYAGPSNVKIGTPTALNGDGHSLQRNTSTLNNAADFVCADPATPQNNAGNMGSMPATTPCQGGAATPTVTPPLAATATSTPMSATPGVPCPCDCNGDHRVTSNELVVAVNLSLGRAQPPCANADRNGDGVVTVDELVAGVDAALNACP